MPEAVARGVRNKGILKNFTKWTGNTCARVSFVMKLQAQAMRLWHRCFPLNISEFLRILFFKEHLQWLLLKCGHYKSEVREIDWLCCRGVDAMLIALAKIPEREENISPSSYYGRLPNYQPHPLFFSTQQMSSSFCSWCS